MLKSGKLFGHLQLREGSIVVDMEIDVDDKRDENILLDLQDKAEKGQFSIMYNNQEFKVTIHRTYLFKNTIG